MTDYEPYSLRQRRAARGDAPVVYQFEPIPAEMRTQAFYALQDAIGPIEVLGYFNEAWVGVEAAIRREHGMMELPASNVFEDSPIERVANYLMNVDTERAVDTIEIAFRFAQSMEDRGFPYASQIKGPYVGITELNRRFKQHGLGYEFVGWPGVIVRVDSQYVQAEVVQPAIALLHSAEFQGPLEEFLKAHQEYRHGDYKGAMNEALKAFESTMKAICDAKGWHREPNWTSSSLIKAMFDHGLIPSALESYFGGIRSILESGVPTLRNRQSGHGQGREVADVPEFLAAFTLHLTAANIVFLMSAYKAIP